MDVHYIVFLISIGGTIKIKLQYRKGQHEIRALLEHDEGWGGGWWWKETDLNFMGRMGTWPGW